jgi:DNA-binding NarL/FixJ family response regulator
VRVVIADDAALVRHGIARLLGEVGVEIAGEAGDGQALLELVAAERPDVAIVDIRMPPGHRNEGLVAAGVIRATFPDTSVLVLSQHVETAFALELLEKAEGGCGYLLKDRVLDVHELVSALERLRAGEIVVEPELVGSLLARRRPASWLDELTAREREVLSLVAEGLTDRGIADRLWLTPKTVETHVRHILRKLDLPAGASNNRRVQAVLAYLGAD